MDGARPEALRARADSPGRFLAATRIDPNRGMDELRRVAELHRKHGLQAIHVTPALLVPQVPIDHRHLFPFYAQAVELDLLVCCRAGVPAEPVPMDCQHPRRVDEVCAFFPELRFVLVDDGLEPWARLVATLLQRHPNLAHGGRRAPATAAARV